MAETSLSLLDRLKGQPDQMGWQRWIDLYTPLIRGWLLRQGLIDPGQDDVVQDVLAVVVRKLPDFSRQPQTGSFRRWLRTITVNCLREYWRSRRLRPRATGASEFLQLLEHLEDPASNLSRHWQEDHDRYVTRRLLEQIRPDFEGTTWQAF